MRRDWLDDVAHMLWLLIISLLVIVGISQILIKSKKACGEDVYCPPTYCSPEVSCYGDCVCVKAHPWDYAGRCFLLMEEE